MISRDALRRRAEEHLGPRLCRATPETVRQFLDWLQLELAEKPPPGERYRLDGPVATFQEVLRDFFWDALEAPAEQAAVSLWLMALEACFAREDEG